MKRRSQKQWQEVIIKQQSGLSAAQFCRDENINQKYFSLRKVNLKKSKSNDLAFTKVNIKPTIADNLTLEYNLNGSTLKFNSLPNALWLGSLIKILS